MALCLIALTCVVALVCVATAHAAEYKAVLCAANNGSNAFSTTTNTASPQNPGGIFNFENYCGPAPDPAGDSAFLRISENQDAGNAGQFASGGIYYDTPPFVHFRSAGGYTRQQYAFNDGWRARFLARGGSAGERELLLQGAGVPNGGTQAATTNIFAPHLWPLGGFLDFTRFVFEMQCVRAGGCDRSNFNSTDANTLVFVLSDESPAQVAFADPGSPLLAGAWVRGAQPVSWTVSDQGSGLRWEQARLDGADVNHIDYMAAGMCDVATSEASGQFARSFNPCPGGAAQAHSFTLATGSLADGAHRLQTCAQDYAQHGNLNGTGSESCDERTVRTDNNPPAAPLGLSVTSANPARYLSSFGASFSLAPDPGSPVVRAHYDVIDASGSVVVPEKAVSAVNPTGIAQVEGPAKPGAYRLRVWLEDQVGLLGPAATAPIPHDTTPPAAPQDLSVAAPSTPRSADGFDARWRNLADAGSPIDAAHYQVVNQAGEVVVKTHDLAAANPQAIESLETPRAPGDYSLRLWLSDAEGNVGAPVRAPLSYDCQRSDAAGGTALSAGLGDKGERDVLVAEGEGSTLSGSLRGAGPVPAAALCVFSSVVTDPKPEFQGVAVTSADGDYRFAVGAGPSRRLAVEYRAGQREISAEAVLRTKVRPTLRLRSRVVRNKGLAVFSGEIPGPRNENVVVVLQVKDGKGWLVFRRFQTREGGRFELRYRFTRTRRPTTYVMRAQVKTQSGYPYEGGESRPVRLRVVP